MNTKKMGRPALAEKKVLFAKRLSKEQVAVVTAALEGKSLGGAEVVKNEAPKLCVGHMARDREEIERYKGQTKALLGNIEELSFEVEGLKARLEELLNNPEGEAAAIWKFRYEECAKALAKYENDGSVG